MPRRVLAAVLTLVLGAALAVAATASARTSDTKLSLVGYAVPREALGSHHQGLAADAGGAGRRASRSRTARRATRLAPSRTASERTSCSSRPASTSTTSSRRASSIPKWNKQSYNGHRHELARRLRRAPRQPQEDQDLGRPRQARRRGDHREPVHVGCREVEHPRGVRCSAEARQDRQAGAGLRARSCSRTSSSRRSRAETRRTRSSPARVTSSSRTRTRRSSRARTARTSSSTSRSRRC